MLMGQKDNVVENTKNETTQIDEPLSSNEVGIKYFCMFNSW